MTSTAAETETVAAAKPRQVYQLFIKATPERVWEGITSEEFTSRYFHQTRVVSDLKPGSPFRSYSNDRSQVLVECAVIESDPPRRLVTSWHMLYDPALEADPPSRVTWELEAVAEGLTELTVIHDGFDHETATYAQTAGGWTWILCNLKTLLETGDTLPTAG
ncbi:MAG: SRPBCC family protein [Chloroflexi bacterium]|nr:SRPBCC family protein [Chloroflexota bacterium]